jgi:hypothetical protein
MVTLTAIAYLQPVTRAALSRLAGKEISRDLIARLKWLDLIAAEPRAPEPGAPYAYVTTRNFLSVFGLASLRDLPTSSGCRTMTSWTPRRPLAISTAFWGLATAWTFPRLMRKRKGQGPSTTKPRNRPSHQRSA